MQTIDIIESMPRFKSHTPRYPFDSANNMVYKEVELRSAVGAELIDRISTTEPTYLTFKNDGIDYKLLVLMGRYKTTDEGDLVTLIVGTDNADYFA